MLAALVCLAAAVALPPGKSQSLILSQIQVFARSLRAHDVSRLRSSRRKFLYVYWSVR